MNFILESDARFLVEAEHKLRSNYFGTYTNHGYQKNYLPQQKKLKAFLCSMLNLDIQIFKIEH